MAAKTRKRAGVEFCIQEGCKEEVHTRGNCKSCYRTLLRSVTAGETSWPDLVAQGLALPAKKAGRKFGALRASIRATMKSPKRK